MSTTYKQVKMTTSVVVTLFVLAIGLSDTTLATPHLKKQNSKPTGIVLKPTDIVGSVGGQAISYKELLENYYKSSPEEKNNPGYKELSDYLRLYLNYKAKLLEAKEAGYYQNRSIIKEYNDYRQQYAYTYWFDHRIKQQMLDQLIKRSKYEIHAEHILIRLSPVAPPRDTLKVYDMLLQARKKFQQGVSFQKLIKEYSSKNKNGQPLGGDLGYITAAQTIKVFEDHVFDTPVGHVSMPFRSKYGYHIVYIVKKRPTIPERLVSHIYFNTHGHNHSVKQAMEKAQKVYKMLQKGVPWDTLVSKYSDDPYSKINHGSLGWINHNRFRPSLSDTIFSIKKEHTYTHPFKSFYGVHIVRLDSIRSYKNEKQREAHFLNVLKRLPRFTNYEKYVVAAAKEYGHAHDYSVAYHEFRNTLPTTGKMDFQTWHISNTLSTKPIYSINGQNYTAGNFYEWIKNQYKGKNLADYNYGLFEQFENHCTQEQIVHLADKLFPHFGNTSKTYLDGLVSYQITQDSVWNYVSSDTAKLKDMYNQHLHKYWYQTRYKFHRIASNKQDILERAIGLLKTGTPADSIRTRLHHLLESRGNAYLIVKHDIVEDISSFPYNYLNNLKTHEISREFNFKNEKSVFFLDEKLPPKQMTFKEAYDTLVSEYQPIREKMWLKRLDAKFDVKLYPEVIKRNVE